MAPVAKYPKESVPPFRLRLVSKVPNREAPKDTSPDIPSWPKPDLVVMFTTAAGLPPYSAEMPPVMTSRLSTLLGSRLLEKVACTWSEMGTPSTM